jgi:protein transport protein SEC23
LDNPDYEHVKEGYEGAHQYANHLVQTRLPEPRLVVCEAGDSQSRFLLARLNPSQTQQNTDGQDVGAVIFTDDVSFDVFMEQLRKLIVGKPS